MAARRVPADGSAPPTTDGESIKVFLRVRPLPKDRATQQKCLQILSNTAVQIDSKPEPRTFTFDRVADEDTVQEDVFTSVGKVVTENCLEGYNGTIFAYGQTGSGKTFTMIGLTDEEDNVQHELRGIIPRTFEHLFSLINREQQKRGDRIKYICQCSFLEIYNERIFDLLDASCTGLQLREDVRQGVIVQDITEVPVESPQEACEVLKAGGRNRRVAETSMNRESSRSHAVFTMSIKSVEQGSGNMKNIREARLNLIDLAGSERQKDTKTEGLRLKEASNINRSLSALGNVIMSLVDVANGKARHVAYRDSKLTFLLRDSLGGNAKTYIIACVNPLAASFGETLSTLQFAARAKMIKNKAVINEDTHGNVKELQDEIRVLKEQLQQASASIIPGICISGAETNDTTALLLHAMESRSIAEREKGELADKVKMLEELVEKKDHVIQSTRMVLKFRESTVNLLEKKRKSEGVVDSSEDQQKTIALLREEIATLRKQVDHHPEVTRFAMENLELRAELKRMHEAYPNDLKENQDLFSARLYTLQLETKIRELVANLNGSSLNNNSSSNNGVPGTPSSRNNNATGRISMQSPAVSAPSPRQQRMYENLEMEKFKMERELERQIADLQRDLQNERTSSSETRKQLKQAEAELLAELSSTKQSLREVEAALETQRLQASIEMSKLQDSLVANLASFSSPRRSLGGAAPTMDPEQVSAKIGSVVEELKSLRLRNQKLVDEASEFEDQQRKMRQQTAKLEKQLESLQALKFEAEAEYAATISGLRISVEKAETDKSTVQKLCETMQMEVTDAHEQVESIQATLTEAAAAHEKAAAELKTKISELEAECTQLSNQAVAAKEALEAERTSSACLADELSTLRAEASFKDDLHTKAEADLAAAAEALAAAEVRLGAMQEQLEREKEAAAQLKMQLAERNEEVITSLLGEKAALNDQLAELQTLSQQQTGSISSLRAELDAAERARDEARTRATKESEVVCDLMKTLQDVRTKLQTAERDAEAHDAELMAAREEAQTAQEKAEDMAAQTADLTRRLAEAEQRAEADSQAAKAKVMELMKNVDDAEQALRVRSQDVAAAQAETDKARKEVARVAQLLEAANSKSVNLESEVAALQHRLAEKAGESSQEDLARRLEESEQQLASYRTQQSKVSQMLTQAEAIRSEKTAEVAALKEQLASLTAAKARMETAAAEQAAVAEQLRTERKDKAALVEAHQTAIAAREREQASLAELLKGSEAKQQALARENDSLKAKIKKQECNVEAALEDAEALVDELKRTRELEKKIFLEKETYKSRMENLMEERHKLEADLVAAQKQIASLAAENDRLAGHQNQAQKIQLHLQIKKENNVLRDELTRLKTKLNKLEPGMHEGEKENTAA